MIRYYPLAGVPRDICAGYGMRGSHLHDACDLCAPTGSAVVAVDDGTVTYGVDPTGGNVAVLHVASGEAYYHAHLEDVQSGQRKVRAGEQIARCDTTGNAAMVGISHVHFQVWPSGNFDQGTVHPDPTSALLAAEVLDAPIGGGSRVWPWALGAAGLLAALGIGAAVGWYLDE